jgi:hypothetical protein
MTQHSRALHHVGLLTSLRHFELAMYVTLTTGRHMVSIDCILQ